MIMEVGNKYVGGDFGGNYYSFFIFPLGIEVFFFNEDIEINFTIWPVQLTFGIGKNRSLFRN